MIFGIDFHGLEYYPENLEITVETEEGREPLVIGSALLAVRTWLI